MRFAARVSTPSSLIVQCRNVSAIFSMSSADRSNSSRCLLTSFMEVMSMGCAFVSEDLRRMEATEWILTTGFSQRQACPAVAGTRLLREDHVDEPVQVEEQEFLLPRIGNGEAGLRRSGKRPWSSIGG